MEFAPGPASTGMAGAAAEGAGERGRAAAMDRAVVGVSAVSGISPSRAKISATISHRIARDACVSSSARQHPLRRSVQSTCCVSSS